MHTGSSTSPWADWLLDFPEIAFESFRPQAGQAAPSLVDFWRSTQGRNRFVGDFGAAQANQIRSGADPTLTEFGFLQDFDFGRSFANMSPRQRNSQPISSFAPRTRNRGFI